MVVPLVTACGHPLAASRGLRLPATQETPAKRSHTVVLIHGMWMTPQSWDPWRDHLAARGLDVMVPAWPLHDGTPEQLRMRHPDAALGRLTLTQVVDHMARQIERLEEPPILIGHSMGGLIVQLLLQRNLGVAGVAVDSAPPKGVLSLRLSSLRSLWGVISPLANEDEPLMPSLGGFTYAWTDALSPEVQREAYTQCVPESRRVGKAPTTSEGAIDFHKAHAPLLFIAGGADNVLPASLTWDNYQAYDDAAGPVAFKEFPGRTHYTVRQPGWEQVVDFVLDWLNTPQ